MHKEHNKLIYKQLVKLHKMHKHGWHMLTKFYFALHCIALYDVNLV